MEDDLIGRRNRHALGETARRCSATSKSTGERCNRAPVVGGFVCTMHGGGAEHVQRAARERLLALVDPALDALLRALRSGTACPACGRTDDDRHPVVIRAAQVVLDRCGLGPRMELEVSRPQDLSGLTEDELVASLEEEAARLGEQLEQMRAWRDAERSRVAAVESRRLLLSDGAKGDGQE